MKTMKRIQVGVAIVILLVWLALTVASAVNPQIVVPSDLRIAMMAAAGLIFGFNNVIKVLGVKDDSK